VSLATAVFIHLVPTHPSSNIIQLRLSILKTIHWLLKYYILILNKIFTVVSQWQRTSYLPFHTYNGTYVPYFLYTNPEYHDAAHDKSSRFHGICSKEYPHYHIRQQSTRNLLKQDQVQRALWKSSRSCQRTGNNQPRFTSLEIP
jgi:hypothetical protein